MQAFALSPVSSSQQPSKDEIDRVDPHQLKELMDKVNSIDLTSTEQKLSRELSWPVEQIAQAVTMYRRFLALQFLFPNAKVVPTKEIDEVWHRHILHTRAYARECKRVFGYFVHHEPSSGTHKENSALKSQFESTSVIYQRLFGEQYGIHAECGNCCDGGSGCHSCNH